MAFLYPSLDPMADVVRRPPYPAHKAILQFQPCLCEVVFLRKFPVGLSRLNLPTRGIGEQQLEVFEIGRVLPLS